MSDKNLKSRIQSAVLKFSIALSAISSVLPAKAAESESNNKNTIGIKTTATPQKNSDGSTVSFADSVKIAQGINNSDLSKKYLEQMKSPIVLKNGEQENIDNYAMKSRVGDLNFLVLNMHSKERQNQTNKANFKQPKDLIKQSNINFVGEDSPLLNKDALAVCSKDGKIYLKVFDKNNEQSSEITQGIRGIEEYKAGNLVAMISTLIHEAVHLKHNLYDNMNDLSYPADIYRANRSTEKIAYSAQNMYAAQLYGILKNNGISELEINGNKIQTESILNYYPGIKDYVLQNGFSPDNKKDVEAISKISSDYWNKNRQNGYRIQNSLVASMRHNAGNIFETIQTDKKLYDTTINNMLRDVYIGNNTNVNLSREFFDDFTFEDALEAMKNINIAGSFTIKKIQEIDNYLTSKNITDNEAKIAYLKENFDHMVLRDGNYDIGLQKILLDTDNENRGIIIYADGLLEKQIDGKHTISGKEGEADIALFNHLNNLKDKVVGNADKEPLVKQGNTSSEVDQMLIIQQNTQRHQDVK